MLTVYLLSQDGLSSVVPDALQSWPADRRGGSRRSTGSGRIERTGRPARDRAASWKRAARSSVGKFSCRRRAEIERHAAEQSLVVGDVAVRKSSNDLSARRSRSAWLRATGSAERSRKFTKLVAAVRTSVARLAFLISSTPSGAADLTVGRKDPQMGGKFHLAFHHFAGRGWTSRTWPVMRSVRGSAGRTLTSFCGLVNARGERQRYRVGRN